jgi:hypothetical protein
MCNFPEEVEIINDPLRWDWGRRSLRRTRAEAFGDAMMIPRTQL